MSAANQTTKIFGMKLGVDPKILVVGLLALAGLLFWINSRGDETPTSSPARSSNETPAAYTPEEPAPAHTRAAATRRRGVRDDRGTLKLRQVTPGTGEVDPVLRLDLLDKLARVEQPPQARNLFEMGPAAAPVQTAALPVRTVVPKPLPPVQTMQPAVPVVPQLNIPLKYYGFAKPSHQGGVSRGFFMDGDNVIVAAEGQMLEGRYQVEQLTPGSARLKDVQMQMSQTMPVTPEALEQNGGGFNRSQAPGMMQQPQPEMNNETPPPEPNEQ